VLLGMIHFFRLLPLEIGFDGQRALEEKLDAMTSEYLANGRVSASRRFDALTRCIHWTYGPNAVPGGLNAPQLRKHAWSVLLEVADESMETAIRLIDEHWNKEPRRSPEIFSVLYLHETPELAYRLALMFRPHRPQFAAAMLRESILCASYQLARLDQTSAIGMKKVMDASCQLLADWVFEELPTDAKDSLPAMDCLFRFGNPEAAYWRKIPKACLAIIKAMEPKEQNRQLRLLAQVVFYGDESGPLMTEAHELFKTCVTRRLGEPQGRNWEWDLEGVVGEACQSLSVLEDKAVAFRNQHIAPNPDHPLLRTVEGQLDGFLQRLLSHEPSSGLSHIVLLTLALSNEALIRKHHQILRNEFELRASSFPVDAGLALKHLIKFCGYGQSDDEMYRKDLCEEAFHALLPMLERISPADATVARTGVGWNPRGNI